ncbi:hypothetical protein CEK28_15955 [Xenophilus sp. AP218F]|nr:hypothetical protein CEK28_15955 [Xenophilus sp. AP218F]
MSALSSVDLFWSLTRGEFSRRDGFDEGKNRFKFAFRGLLTLPWTLRWLKTLGSQSLLPYLRQNPRLACKLHRPYLYRSLGSRGKLAALRAHYQLLRQCLAPAIHQRLLSSETLSLANLAGKNDAPLAIRLTHQHSFDKEGELSLQVCNGEGVPVATLTFTLTLLEGEAAIVIGGLQGPCKPHGNECVQTLTKTCHGLFPKRLAAEAVLAIAEKFGCRQVLAVGKREHIYSSWRYRRNFFADYDSFWGTLEAEALEKGRFFRLPLVLPRKAMADIASKKRAEYQRRYGLLDELRRQVAASL